MKSILIADTTREEREQIVAESVGNIDGACDGCSPGLIKMYRDYIEGKASPLIEIRGEAVAPKLPKFDEEQAQPV